MATIQLNVTEQGDTLVATAKSRMNLAIHHLFGACRLAAQVGAVESANQGKALGEFWEEIFQCSLGVATLSVACLECYANELFFEASALQGVLKPEAAALVAELVDNQSIIRKYSAAAVLRTGKDIDRSVAEVQNMDALVRLRNAVVHFRPEWFGEQDKHAKLSQVLQHKFGVSPFLSSEPIFPRAWASHAFSIWALKSTTQFLEYFHNHAGLPSPIASCKPRISSLSGGAL